MLPYLLSLHHLMDSLEVSMVSYPCIGHGGSRFLLCHQFGEASGDLVKVEGWPSFYRRRRNRTLLNLSRERL